MLAIWAAPAAAESSLYVGASRDGAHLFFNTEEALVEADTDDAVDLYERVGRRVRLVAVGPLNPSGAEAQLNTIAHDGSWVHFDTKERLVAADQDERNDCYERRGGITTLLTTWHEPYPCPWNVSADGNRMFFMTAAPIDPSDTDTEIDLYMRLNGNVTFLSPGLEESFGEFAVADDGSSFYFSTSEQVDPADTDNQYDVYRRVNGSYVFISQGGTCPRKACRAELDSGVTSGGRGFFNSNQQLVPEDTDEGHDLYLAENGTLTLIDNGHGSYSPFPDITPDAQRVIFHTHGSLVPADKDRNGDLYLWEDGTYTLIGGAVAGRVRGGAELLGAGPGFRRLVISTGGALLPSDRDGDEDIYRWSPGRLELVTKGRPASDYEEIGMTADMRRIFFTAPEPYLRADRDEEYDVYAWEAGRLELISQRRLRGPAGNAMFKGTGDSGVAFFATREVHSARDRDDQVDIYAELDGRTTLMTPAPRSEGERLYGEVGTVPGRNGAVTFTVDCGRRCDQSGIYSVSARRTGARRLIDDGRAAQSSFSPDGRWIAFVTQGTYYGQSHIWVMRPDGRGARRLTSDDARESDPGWLPDGRVTFSSDRDGDRDFYAAPVGGGPIQNLGEAIGATSPDGRFVVMTECPWQGDCDLLLRRRNGSLVRRLAPSPAAELEPQFSPDGRRIAFISNRGDRERNPFLVYLINRSGGPPKVFRKSRYNDAQEGPTFSPDGRSLLFEEYGQLTLGSLATGKTSRFPSGDESSYYADWQSLPRSGAGG